MSTLYVIRARKRGTKKWRYIAATARASDDPRQAVRFSAVKAAEAVTLATATNPGYEFQVTTKPKRRTS